MPMKQPEPVGDSLPLDIHAPRMHLDQQGLCHKYVCCAFEVIIKKASMSSADTEQVYKPLQISYPNIRSPKIGSSRRLREALEECR